MSAVATHNQPSKAAAFLQKQIDQLPADAYKTQRLTILTPALATVRAIPDESWHTLRSTAEANATRAWRTVGDALAAAGLYRGVEVVNSALDGIGDTANRYAQGDAGGLAGIRAATGDSFEQVGLPDPFDAANARGGKNDDTDKWWKLSPVTILKWGLPLVAVAAGTWYFWPVAAAALRVRRTAARGLERGLDRVGVRDVAPPSHPESLLGFVPMDFDVPVVEEFALDEGLQELLEDAPE